MAVKVTRCPHCATRFRVNLDLLNVADGAVRCGSCLQVFQADQHMFNSGADTVASSSTTEHTLDTHQVEAEPAKERDLGSETLNTEETLYTQLSMKGASDEQSQPQTDVDRDETRLLSESPSLRHSDPIKPDDLTDTPAGEGFKDETLSPEFLVEKLPRRWPWVIGILIAFAMLLLQIMLFHFDQGARSPQWRPLYSQLCMALGCELPKPQDVSLIESQHLIIRPHPTDNDVLMVDTLLVNQADWPQPYPDLLLEFRDINGQAVAARRFTPTDYLPQNLQPLMIPTSPQPNSIFTREGQILEIDEFMPSFVAIHIALQIVNPGDQATAYELIPMVNLTQ